MAILIVSLASLAVTGIMAASQLVSNTKEVEPANQIQKSAVSIGGLILVGTAGFIIYKSFK